jgi:hypothetical protein
MALNKLTDMEYKNLKATDKVRMVQNGVQNFPGSWVKER